MRLHLNHYIMSFGMYWMHRACHMVPWMWEKIHSIHHYADHPLSRTTYQDHWFDNFANAVIGHCFAQILMVRLYTRLDESSACERGITHVTIP